MANKEIIIDDEYFARMKEYFTKQGERFDKLVYEYITILQDISNRGIMSGEVATSLNAYIACAKKLNQSMTNVSLNVNSHIDIFLAEVDEEDNFLF